MTFHTFRFAALLIFLFGLLGCKTETNEKKHYSFYILAKDGREYLMEYNVLDQGNLTPANNGVLLEGRNMDRDVIVKDGYYYHLDRKTTLFSKSSIHDKKLQSQFNIPLKDFSIENFNWLATDTLLLTGLNISGYNQTRFFLIDTKAMQVIRQGDMEIPKPSGKFTTLSIGLVDQQGDHLNVAYTYHITKGVSDYITSDTMYVSALSYPEMKLIKTDKDVRSTYPGGINTIQSYSFIDGNNDNYFMTCPGIALGNRPEIPTGVFRIKSGSSTIDKNYFFNISASKINNHAYGMWPLGNGKVIVRSERKDLFKGLGDHYSTAHFEFYVLDLQTKDVTRLNLPLDKGTRRECVLVEGDTAYIAVNSNKAGNFIWLYNIKTGSLKKGLQFGGDTDFILRMDRLN